MKVPMTESTEDALEALDKGATAVRFSAKALIRREQAAYDHAMEIVRKTARATGAADQLPFTQIISELRQARDGGSKR